MRYQQFENAIQGSFDVRVAEDQLKAAQSARDQADAKNLKLHDQVVKGVVADVVVGDDSPVYGVMGYRRKSASKTGLNRKTLSSNTRKLNRKID